MRSSHFTSSSHRKINEIDFASPWQVHLTVPPFSLTW
jgi:hypothetical protein